MDEIKVGEWVRTKEGEIIKVREDYVIFTDDDGLFIDTYMLPYEQKVVEHSENIIDLIECGDYVNGKEIKKVNEWKSSKEGYFKYLVTELHEIIRGDEIKSIVTKEQFSSVEYRLEEGDK